MLLLQQDLCWTDTELTQTRWLHLRSDSPRVRIHPAWRQVSAGCYQVGKISLQCHLLDYYLSAVQDQESCWWLFRTLPCDQGNETKKERRNTTERNVWCVCKGMTPASQRCFSHSCACLISCPDGHVAPAWTKQPRSSLVNGLGWYAPLEGLIHLV